MDTIPVGARVRASATGRAPHIYLGGGMTVCGRMPLASDLVVVSDEAQGLCRQCENAVRTSHSHENNAALQSVVARFGHAEVIVEWLEPTVVKVKLPGGPTLRARFHMVLGADKKPVGLRGEDEFRQQVAALALQLGHHQVAFKIANEWPASTVGKGEG